MVYVILENIDQNKKFKVKHNIVFSYMKDNSITAIQYLSCRKRKRLLLKLLERRGELQ